MKKDKKKSTKKEENRWVDVRNDKVMREMGILRPLPLVPRSSSVWTKTQLEKDVLREERNCTRKGDMHFHTIPYRHSTVRAKLIIYLKPNKDFDKSTYSKECSLSDVAEVLSNYKVYNKKSKSMESVVAKYSYDGKTYTNSFPYWTR